MFAAEMHQPCSQKGQQGHDEAEDEAGQEAGAQGWGSDGAAH